MKLDALIRVSQQAGRTGEEFRSPEQQREIIEQWASANGAEIVAWHEAIDVSGKTMARADVDAVLGRLRARQTEGLVVAWANRLSRSRLDEAAAFHGAIKDAGGRLVVCEFGGIDLDTAAGELIFNQALAFARYQWRQYAERWQMSQRDAIKAGKAMGAPPFGYRYADATPRHRGRGVVDSRLVPNEQQATTVRELFERKAAGATWLELARWLDRAAPKQNGRRWARSSAATIVACRTYLGEVRHGEHVRADAHEPLVSAAVWRRAQNEPGRRTPRGTYLLGGLVRCAGCGRSMQGSARNGARLYVCRYDGCRARSNVRAPLLDAEVVEQLFTRLGEFHARAVDDTDVAGTREDVSRLTGEVERLAAVVPTHPSAVAAHQRALEAAEGSLTNAEDRLHGLLAALSEAGPDVHELRKDWPSLTLEERREILRAGVDVALVRRFSDRGRSGRVGERVLVLFRGEAPAALNRRAGAAASWAWDDGPGSLRAAA